MERQVDLMEISDGKLYGLNDMVKACANNCDGCSACCHGRGDTITLDPLDVHHLKTGLQTGFEQLMTGGISLGVVNGIIRPSMMMTEEEDSKCIFLNAQGRCGIHSFRPGLCRLFPLGRVYEEDGIKYILLTGECVRENRTKVKVRKWIDMPDMDAYEKFLIEWHDFLKEIEAAVTDAKDDTFAKNLNMYVLRKFYVENFGETEEQFYLVFAQRLLEARKIIFG
ncbi:MAG: YkgJ family cysteine cluster protein [Lachnospiraceae bacterium]|nr:YkgJ family cysteine cluster protein [Lachnospiraceae bacterium]